MKVLLTGGRGMVGRAILRVASDLAPDWVFHSPSREELDLLDRSAVRKYLQSHNFDLVIHAAGKVGGIKANMADSTGFLFENILMGSHIIEESRLAGVSRLINLGSSCMYPKDYSNPLKEEYILAAPLEPTNEGYALAKIIAERLCRYISEQYGFTYRTFIPCNLYGPGDHFDPVRGHLISAAILKVHTAKEKYEGSVEIWGDGHARREFMYVDDLAHFVLEAADKLEKLPVCLNTGVGTDNSVNDYYEVIAEVLGYEGAFAHNLDAPVGMKQKLMDSSLASKYGWSTKTSLKEGIQNSYNYFLELNNNSERGSS